MKFDYPELTLIKSFSSGSAQPQIPIKDLKFIKVSLPPLATQKKIAAVLSAYDELIEKNNRKIEILEKMAEEIYREWFVRMRFPGYENTKFHKGIPDGWEEKKLGEIVDRLNFGRIYRESELQHEGSVVVIDQSTKNYLGFYNGKPEHVATLEEPIIIFGDHSCKMQIMIKPFSLAENVIPFKSLNKVNLYFLFFTIYKIIETQEYKRHWTEFCNKKILLPQVEFQKKFSNEIKNNLDLKEKLLIKNQNLTKTRDLLLPRLISGKLNVEDLEIDS
ncbi:MAG: restriction endonuclease subunit S [Leptospiraceae bacterium]|nr:restriction endonuclease subunit S [Leptospiraceae bacterium]MCP5494648.1 restriction endonuclease subunit S [Leptospiraceae bacterium]